MQTNWNTKLAKHNTKEVKERVIPNGKLIFILPYTEPEVVPYVSRSSLPLKLFIVSILQETLSVMGAMDDLSVYVFPSTETYLDVLFLHLATSNRDEVSM